MPLPVTLDLAHSVQVKIRVAVRRTPENRNEAAQ